MSSPACTNVKPLCTEVKPPIDDFLATVLAEAGRRTWRKFLQEGPRWERLGENVKRQRQDKTGSIYQRKKNVGKESYAVAFLPSW